APAGSGGGAAKGVEVGGRGAGGRQEVREDQALQKRGAGLLGFGPGESASPVIPVVVGTDETAFRTVLRLQELGVFANPVVSPAVRSGRAMIRTSYMATHTREHLDRALEAFALVARELGIGR